MLSKQFYLFIIHSFLFLLFPDRGSPNVIPGWARTCSVTQAAHQLRLFSFYLVGLQGVPHLTQGVNSLLKNSNELTWEIFRDLENYCLFSGLVLLIAVCL